MHAIAGDTDLDRAVAFAERVLACVVTKGSRCLQDACSLCAAWSWRVPEHAGRNLRTQRFVTAQVLAEASTEVDSVTPADGERLEDTLQDIDSRTSAELVDRAWTDLADKWRRARDV